jgi:hypothetical protein
VLLLKAMRRASMRSSRNGMSIVFMGLCCGRVIDFEVVPTHVTRR